MGNRLCHFIILKLFLYNWEFSAVLAPDDAHNRCLGTPIRPAASRISLAIQTRPLNLSQKLDLMQAQSLVKLERPARLRANVRVAAACGFVEQPTAHKPLVPTHTLTCSPSC